MTNEINWAAPVVGKLEIGKTYVDRKGDSHLITLKSGRLRFDASSQTSWWNCGSFSNDENQRHVLDFIAEYTPPAPLKMWMNEYHDCLGFHESELSAKQTADLASAVRIAVPVTITEGH